MDEIMIYSGEAGNYLHMISSLGLSLAHFHYEGDSQVQFYMYGALGVKVRSFPSEVGSGRDMDVSVCCQSRGPVFRRLRSKFEDLGMRLVTL